ncbi:MAG: FxsA family protein [Amaricoccus sp.]
MAFLLILLALPLIEITLFILVGGWIGLWPTLGLVLASCAAGSAVLRANGFRVMGELQRTAEAGGDPRGPLAHGALIMLAGILLLIPGFFTDAVALLLLIPPVRDLLIGWGAARTTARMTVRASRFGNRRGPARPAPTEIIDADYEVVEGDGPAPHGRSGWTQPPPPSSS